jgi:hypothetical protein
MYKWTFAALAGMTLALASGCGSAPAENAEEASEAVGDTPTCAPQQWLAGEQFETMARQICTDKSLALTGAGGQGSNSAMTARCSTTATVYGACPADGWGNEWMTLSDLQRCWGHISPQHALVSGSSKCFSLGPDEAALSWMSALTPSPGGCGTSCM